MINILKNLHKTFYDPLFYRDLVSNGKGIGIRFLLLVSFIKLVQFGFVVIPPLSIFLNEQEAVFESLPTLTIKDGTLSSDQTPQEFVLLKGYENGEIKIVIDTKADPMDPVAITKKMMDENILVYVAKDGISLLDPATNAVDQKDARNFKSEVITHQSWLGVSHFIKTFLAPLIFFSAAIGVFLGHLITSALGALFLFIIAPLFKITPSFAGFFRLSAAAKVPVALIFLILTPQVLMQTLLWFGFAVFGLISNRKNTGLS